MSSKFDLPPELDIGVDEDFTKDRLDEAFSYIVKRFLILDSFQPDYIAQLDLLRGVGLDRLNQVFEPIYARLKDIADLGVIFTAETDDTILLSAGTKLFTIPEDHKDQFAPAAYLTATSKTDSTKYFSGKTGSYDRTTGLLTIIVNEVTGTGSQTGWILSPTSSPNLSAYTREQVDGLLTNLIGGATSTGNTLKKLQDLLISLQGAVSALDGNKADKSSPSLTGIPTTTKPAAADNTNRIPTTSWVNDAISGAGAALTKLDARAQTVKPFEIRFSETETGYQYANSTSYAFNAGAALGDIWSVSITTGKTTFLKDVQVNTNLTTKGFNLSANGTEGGEMKFSKGTDGTGLSGDGITVDQTGTKIRFFDSGGTFKGVSLDVSTGTANAGATLWHSGNFTPANYAALNANVTFQSINLNFGGSKALIYTDSGSHIVAFRTGSGADANNPFRYSYFDAAGGLNVAGGLAVAGGGCTLNGDLVVGNARNYSQINMFDSDHGTRYLHCNSGYIGFLGTDGGWSVQTNNAGDIWSRDGGWLSARLNGKLSTAGGTITGDLTVSKSYPSVKFFYSGVKAGSWQIRENAWMYYMAENGTTAHFGIGPGGEVYTQQFGDLNTRIETRAREWAQAVAGNIRTRLAYAGDQSAGTARAATGGNGIWEPYAGGVVTGHGGYRINESAELVWILRYRYLQASDQFGNWYTVSIV